MLNVLIKMENEGRSKYTINFTRKALSLLSQHTNLEDPEQVKAFIAKKDSGNGYKGNLYCLQQILQILRNTMGYALLSKARAQQFPPFLHESS